MQPTPYWSDVIRRLGASLPAIEGTVLVQGSHLLTLHLYTVYKLQSLRDVTDKLYLLQNLHRILENYKTK